MIITTSILALPILAIDLYLLLAGVRLITSRIPVTAGASSSLAGLTDAFPNLIGSWLTRKRRKSIPRWLPWLIVAVAAMIIRQLLFLMILRAH